MYYETFGKDGEYLGRKYLTKEEYEQGIGQGEELTLEQGDEGYEEGKKEEEELEENRAALREAEEEKREREKEMAAKKKVEEEEAMSGNSCDCHESYLNKQGFTVFGSRDFAELRGDIFQG